MILRYPFIRRNVTEHATLLLIVSAHVFLDAATPSPVTAPATFSAACEDPFFLLPLSSHLEFTRPPSGRRPPLLRGPPASSNHLRSRNIARLIEQFIDAFQESHRMRQSCVQLKRRLIHPPRMYEKQPPVPHRLEGVKTQAALLLPRRPCHLAQGLLHRTLFSRMRVQPHKRILLHGSLHLPTS